MAIDQRAQLLHIAQAAAIFPGTARIDREPDPLDRDWKPLFDELGRQVLGIGHEIDCIGPIGIRPCTRAGTEDLTHQEQLAFEIEAIEAIDLDVLHIGDHIAVEHFGERHRIGAYHAQHAGHATDDGRRKFRTEDGAFRDPATEDLSDAFVDDDAGDLCLKERPEPFRIMPTVERPVHRATGLRVGAFEIEDHFIRVFADRDFQFDGLVQGEAVVLDKVLADIFAIREHRQTHIAHDFRTTIHDFVERSLNQVTAEALAQFDHAPTDDLVGTDEGIDIAAKIVWKAAVAQQDVVERLIECCLLIQLDRGAERAFFENAGRSIGPGARLSASDIADVSENLREANDATFPEYRRDHTIIGEMADGARRFVHIVVDKNVAWVDLLERKFHPNRIRSGRPRNPRHRQTIESVE